MADIQEETQAKIRRSLGLEFVRMEDDFDETRDLRKRLTSKLVETAVAVQLVDPVTDENGRQIAKARDDTTAGVAIVNAALKALDATEKASVTAIGMKLRHSEQEAASAAQAKDRILVVLEATKPGRVNEQLFDPAALSHTLTEMFDSEIKPFETKSNPHSLSEEEDD